MALPIEDYALIGDSHTAALVGRDGSIDWLCFPRFDSGACFAALLGEPRHGRWLIAPDAPALSAHRRYRERTLILETTIETRDGAVRIIDYMPFLNQRRDVVRIVEGLRGRVTMRLELIIRFDYGSIVPWVHQVGDVLQATAGPHTLELMSPVAVRGENKTTVAEFVVGAGERIPFALSYRRSYEPPQRPVDPEKGLVTTENEWRQWSGRCTYEGRWRDAVIRSLITLKALVYAPTGGIVAAPTTSLPEQRGGVRNWDYRYCWLRDAAFTLNALLLTGYHDEAIAWREWLLRAVAGCPEDLQILYSVTGERRLEEYECPWLPGYEGAAPVRVGNAASKQFQLDVYGEVMDTLHIARAVGLVPEPAAWRIQVALLNFLELNWQRPDAGIWEMRGPCRHFTHSKVMAWVAFDRGIKDAQTFALDGPVERWQEIRTAIHAQICAQGYDAKTNTFVQSYGSSYLDASLLLIPQVGFLPATDPRVRGTVEAIERSLVVDGLVQRYSTVAALDGLPPREGTFLPCSFWLADCLVMIDRRADGEALFERLLALTNDLGLLAEEYDTRKRHMLGNFPQALTHMALINTACLLTLPAEDVQRVGTQGRCSLVVAPK
ncbi:MAG: glycoside hydrolase family 15 protein [Acidiferrobacter sp.]